MGVFVYLFSGETSKDITIYSPCLVEQQTSFQFNRWKNNFLQKYMQEK
jgi:hypothetical protein